MNASPTDGKKLLVFLSHASQDKAPVRELCAWLRADGFDPWLDEERLLPGMNWDLEIEKALRASDAILLCFSELSVKKEGYIQREYKRAMRYQEEKPEGTIYVIPVRLDKCELPYFIKDIQFVDFPDDYDRLVVALRLRSGKTTSAPPLPREQKAARPEGGTATSGGVNIQGSSFTVGGDVVGGNKTVYGAEATRADTLKAGFARIYGQIQRLPDNGDADKDYIIIFVQDIERETAKGHGCNEKKLRNSLRMLRQNSEEIYAVVASLLRSPDSNLSVEIQTMLD